MGVFPTGIHDGCHDPRGGIGGLPWVDSLGSVSMLKSMTGYGRAEGTTATHLYAIEVQAFNHRFTDIRVRLPRTLTSLEHGLHRQLRERVHRGRFDVQVTEKILGEIPRAVRIDRVAIAQYVAALKDLQRELDLGGHITVDALIGLRDLIGVESAELDLPEVEGLLRQLLGKALDEVDAMRRTEGAHLAQGLATGLDQMEAALTTVEGRAPEVVLAIQARLAERIAALLGSPLPDPERLAQEVALLADRSDVTEECTRLRSHYQQARAILVGEPPHGRRLEFLLQEMVREVNTIGAKAADVVISPVVVEMKAELERFREQIQNIE